MKGVAPLVTVISLLISLLLIDLCPSSSSWVTRHNFPPFGQCYYHEALWVVGTRGGSSDGGANSTSDELFQPPVQSSSSIIMDDRLETKENKYTNIIHSTATGKEQEEPTADGPFQVTNKAHNAAAATSNVQPTLSVHQPEQNSCTMNGSCSIVVDRKMKENSHCSSSNNAVEEEEGSSDETKIRNSCLTFLQSTREGANDEQTRTKTPGMGLILAAAGCQGSGKSSLLNEMLGTHFPVQPTSAPGTCTTIGAVIEMAKGIVAIDLEGLEGLDQKAQALAASRFAVNAADVIVVNMWTKDAARQGGQCGGGGSLHFVLAEAARVRQQKETLVVVTMRDVETEQDGLALENEMLKGVKDVLVPGQTLVFHALPNPFHRATEFSLAVKDLLSRIIDVGHPRYVCSGTIHNATIARKNWDDMKMMSHLKALWDNAGLSKGSFEVIDGVRTLTSTEAQMRVDGVEMACAALEDKVKCAGDMGNPPILEFGFQARDIIDRTLKRNLEEQNVHCDTTADEEEVYVLQLLATRLQVAYENHLRQLHLYFLEKFDDKFGTVIGGASDFEDKARSVQIDVEEGMSTACQLATPDPFRNFWDPRKSYVLEALSTDIKCRIADRIAEDTWMIPSEADIMDALGEGCSTAMPRWKRWALQAAAFGVNYLQVAQGRRQAIQECHKREGSEGRIKVALNRADAILLVYDTGHLETFDVLEEYWLPMIAVVAAENIPVVVVCNKTDVCNIDAREIGGSPLPSNVSVAEWVSDKVARLMKEFKFIRLGLFCSAKNSVGIQDVFQVISMSVLYPTPTLFDVETGTLQPAFCKVLARVFRIHDNDFDSLWSNAELKDFQFKCFGSGLSEDEIDIIKKVLLKQNPKYGDELFGGGASNYLTLRGLMELIVMFIDKNQLVMPWMIPAYYGYDADLKLIVEPGHQIPLNDVRPFKEGGCNLQQLTNHAQTFLRKTFEQFANSDGLLTRQAEASIFSIIDDPVAAPWDISHLCDFAECGIEPDSFSDPIYFKNSNQAMNEGRNQDEWLALWQMVASLKPSIACEFLYRLGYIEVDEEERIHATRKRDKLCLDGSNSSSSSLIVHAFVFGSEGCKEGTRWRRKRRSLEGNSVNSSSTLDKSDHGVAINVHLNPSKPRSWAVPVRMTGGGTTSLILTEVGSEDVLWVRDNIVAIEHCDVAVIVFDPLDAASVDYALEVTKHLPGKLPRLMAGIRQNRYRKKMEVIGDGGEDILFQSSSSLGKIEALCRDDGLECQPFIIDPAFAMTEQQRTEVRLKLEDGIDMLEEQIIRTAADPSCRRKAIPKKFRTLNMARIFEMAGSNIANVKLGIVVGGLVVLGIAASSCMIWRWNHTSRSRDCVRVKGSK